MGNIVAIVGRPNVGKSTLFNRLTETRNAIVDEMEGVTRDRQYGKAVWNGIEFSVIDTGGYISNSSDVFEEEIRKQVMLAIEESDSILFMVDTLTGITDLDESVANLLRKIDKPVLLVDVYNNEVKFMEELKNKTLKQRILSVEKFKEAKKIGIIIGVKTGQVFGVYKDLIDKFEKAGKKVFLITMSEFSPDKLTNFREVNAFVELACPRIAIDDFARYNKPIITFREALVALGEKSWEQVMKEGLL